MNSFLSIIEVSPNLTLDDKVSLGVIIVSPNQVWFHYDQDLLRFLKPLLREAFPALDKILKMMRRKFKSLESKQLDLYQNVGEYFQNDLYKKLALEQDGIIRFSSPQPIAIPTFTEEGFMGVFHSIIGNWESKKKGIINEERKKVDQNLLRPLSKSMHTHYRLGPRQIDRLYFTFPIDAVGQQKDIYLIKYLDKNHTNQTLERKAMRLFFLTDAMQKQYNTSINTFIISSRPSARSRAKKYIYQLLERRRNIQIVDPDDVLQILKLLKQKDVKKIWE
jgi:hypothetical protein